MLAPNENRFADAETLLPPWNQQENSGVYPASRKYDLMTCSSCHTTHRNTRRGYQADQPDPVGAHGSNIPGMLRDRLEVRSGDTPFCSTCHRPNIYVSGSSQLGERGTRFSEHRPDIGEHGSSFGCLECHVGGGKGAVARSSVFRTYIHGASLPSRTEAVDGAGPVVSFLFGDGIRWVEQQNLSCFTEGFCSFEHGFERSRIYPLQP